MREARRAAPVHVDLAALDEEGEVADGGVVEQTAEVANHCSAIACCIGSGRVKCVSFVDLTEEEEEVAGRGARKLRGRPPCTGDIWGRVWSLASREEGRKSLSAPQQKIPRLTAHLSSW